jgi:hypothetical protein
MRMLEVVGKALSQFDEAVAALETQVGDDTAVREAVFAGSESWLSLLRHKLAPQFEGAPCLVVAVAGGTNTGKSTIFNLLVGRSASPARATAAATCHPVLAASASRAKQCLDGAFFAEFNAQPLGNGDAVIGHEAPDDSLFVTETDSVPEALALLDTPDVDSIDQANWSVAENIRAAGDVIIAVITGEKYKDEKVIAFFRAAAASGRIVLPLMNKAQSHKDFEAARVQLEDFCKETGVDGPAFIVPHDPAAVESFTMPIAAADGGPDLLAYLASLDVNKTKDQVWRKTVHHFATEAGHFLNHLEDFTEALRGVADEFSERGRSFASRYEPAPGAAIGGLFHEYVQARRGPVRRVIGNTSSAVTKGAVKVGKTVSDALRRRATLDTSQRSESESELTSRHGRALERITRDLARSYVDSSQNLGEPAGRLVRDAIEAIDVERAVESVGKEVLQSESISDEYRAHAHAMLDAWWDDNTGRRKVLEALDGILAVMPTAIALPIAINTAGYGVAETIAVTGPLAEQFLARVIEFQFGDALFDFISPWRQEQQDNLLAALEASLVEPALAPVQQYLSFLDDGVLDDMRRWQQQCLNASATS